MSTVEDTRKLTNPYVQTVSDSLGVSTAVNYGDSTRMLLEDILLQLIKIYERMEEK